MHYTQKLSTATDFDTALYGGKACGLMELQTLHDLVPDGFVVATTAFNETLKQANLLDIIYEEIRRIDVEDDNAIARASATIQQAIQHVTIPESIRHEVDEHFGLLNVDIVAVRSSATAEDGHGAAWAGQLDSFLYVDKVSLLDKIRSCWASLFSERALLYQIQAEIVDRARVAVVVQEIVPSEVAGVAFSMHPASKNYQQIVIEAGWGMGEAVVSGQITPDLYVVEKDTNMMHEINVSTQEKSLQKHHPSTEGAFASWQDVPEAKQRVQKLSDARILELATMVQTIENHFGFPCDIEWALADGKIYLLQSRPITAL
jgi:pyruvate,water dikinase